MALSARMLALSWARRPSIAEEEPEEPEEPATAVRGVLNACSGSAASRDRFAVAAVLGVLGRVSLMGSAFAWARAAPRRTGKHGLRTPRDVTEV